MAQEESRPEIDTQDGGLQLRVDQESLKQLVALANIPQRRTGTPLSLELVLALLGVLLAVLGLGVWIAG